MNVVRNLDGARIRGRRIKVSFAKYGKNDKLQNGSILVETGKEAESVRGSDKYRINTRDRRSFKEVVEDLSQHSKLDGWGMEKNRTVAVSTVDKYEMQLEKVKLKGMVWRLVEEIFNSINLK